MASEPPEFVNGVRIWGKTSESRIFVKMSNTVEANKALLRAKIGSVCLYTMHVLRNL